MTESFRLGVWVDRLSLVAGVLLCLLCVTFVLVHRDVVLNRFTDSWWHVAAAEEYADTGVFAKDPFFKDAPPFAQFGLIEFVNAWLCRLTGLHPRSLFPVLVACNVGVFIAAAFMAGYLPDRQYLDGCISAALWAVLYPSRTIIGLGFPFATAVALLAVLLLVVWSERDARRPGVLGIAWRGLLLGFIFALHAFVGLVGGAVMAVHWVTKGWGAVKRGGEAAARYAGNAFILALAFFAVAWPWVVHHLRLRSALAGTNAHMRAGYPVDVWSAVGVVLGCGLLALVLRSSRADGDGCRFAGVARPLLVFGLVLTAFALPPLNGWLQEHTSWYMARRVPWLFPLAPVIAVSVGCITRVKTHAAVRVAVLAGSALIVAPALKEWVPLQVYLARTTDYDRHEEYAYLDESLDRMLKGRTILADPTTSYYVRGMAGGYVMTMIPGEGSPAIDYGQRDTQVRTALREGPSALTGEQPDAVLLDKRSWRAETFSGMALSDIVHVWQKNGWKLTKDDPEFLLLTRAAEEASPRP